MRVSCRQVQLGIQALQEDRQQLKSTVGALASRVHRLETTLQTSTNQLGALQQLLVGLLNKGGQSGSLPQRGSAEVSAPGAGAVSAPAEPTGARQQSLSHSMPPPSPPAHMQVAHQAQAQASHQQQQQQGRPGSGGLSSNGQVAAPHHSHASPAPQQQQGAQDPAASVSQALLQHLPNDSSNATVMQVAAALQMISANAAAAAAAGSVPANADSAAAAAAAATTAATKSAGNGAAAATPVMHNILVPHLTDQQAAGGSNNALGPVLPLHGTQEPMRNVNSSAHVQDTLGGPLPSCVLVMATGWGKGLSAVSAHATHTHMQRKHNLSRLCCWFLAVVAAVNGAVMHQSSDRDVASSCQHKLLRVQTGSSSPSSLTTATPSRSCPSLTTLAASPTWAPSFPAATPRRCATPPGRRRAPTCPSRPQIQAPSWPRARGRPAQLS